MWWHGLDAASTGERGNRAARLSIPGPGEMHTASPKMICWCSLRHAQPPNRRSPVLLPWLPQDIARQVIAANRLQYAAQLNWRFEVLDVTAEQLPRGYDMVFSRDMLQHLECRRVVASLAHIAQSGAKYLLVGSYDDVERNANITSGGQEGDTTLLTGSCNVLGVAAAAHCGCLRRAVAAAAPVLRLIAARPAHIRTCRRLRTHQPAGAAVLAG